MRTIERSSAFKRDYEREAKGHYRATLDAALVPVLTALADDLPLEPRHRDHDLSGEWAGYRDCHVKPDLVLIYRKADADILRLARLGSHSELFGSSARTASASPGPCSAMRPACITAAWSAMYSTTPMLCVMNR